MSAKFKGVVEVKALGQTFHLIYDFNLLCEMEDEHPDLMNGGFDEGKFKSPKYVRDILYRGLRDGQGERPSIEVAGAIISALGIVPALELVATAIKRSFGFNDDGTPVLKPDPNDAKN